MKATQEKQRSGLTLIEVMVAIVVIAVGILGASGFRYYCALDARKADVQITASRLGSLLLEGWIGAGGNSEYDPVAQFGSELKISAATNELTVLAHPSGFSLLGIYTLAVDRTNYMAILSYKSETSAEPRVLNAVVAWPISFGKETDSAVSYDLIRLTNYINEEDD